MAISAAVRDTAEPLTNGVFSRRRLSLFACPYFRPVHPFGLNIVFNKGILCHRFAPSSTCQRIFPPCHRGAVPRHLLTLSTVRPCPWLQRTLSHGILSPYRAICSPCALAFGSRRRCLWLIVPHPDYRGFDYSPAWERSVDLRPSVRLAPVLDATFGRYRL